MSEKKKRMAIDGNYAAAYASYAFTEVAGIYPITPSSPMAGNGLPRPIIPGSPRLCRRAAPGRLRIATA